MKKRAITSCVVPLLFVGAWSAVVDAQRSKRNAARYEDYQLPAGTPLTVRLRSALASDSSRAGDQVRAAFPDAVTREGTELIPAGSLVHGKVVDSVAATKRDPRGRIEIAFYVIEHAGTGSRASIRTRPLVFKPPEPANTGESSTKKQPIDVQLSAGEVMTLTLAAPLVVRIPSQ